MTIFRKFPGESCLHSRERKNVPSSHNFIVYIFTVSIAGCQPIGAREFL